MQLIRSGPLLGIHIGRNAIDKLSSILKLMQCTAVGMVVSEGCPVLQKVVNIVESMQIAYCAKSVSYSFALKDIDEAAQNFRKINCQLVLAVGDQPAFDVARVVSQIVNPDSVHGYQTVS